MSPLKELFPVCKYSSHSPLYKDLLYLLSFLLVTAPHFLSFEVSFLEKQSILTVLIFPFGLETIWFMLPGLSIKPSSWKSQLLLLSYQSWRALFSPDLTSPLFGICHCWPYSSNTFSYRLNFLLTQLSPSFPLTSTRVTFRPVCSFFLTCISTALFFAHLRTTGGKDQQ